MSDTTQTPRRRQTTAAVNAGYTQIAALEAARVRLNLELDTLHLQWAAEIGEVRDALKRLDESLLLKEPIVVADQARAHTILSEHVQALCLRQAELRTLTQAKRVLSAQIYQLEYPGEELPAEWQHITF